MNKILLIILIVLLVIVNIGVIRDTKDLTTDVVKFKNELVNLEKINSKLNDENLVIVENNKILKEMIEEKEIELKKESEKAKKMSEQANGLFEKVESYRKILNYKPYFSVEDNEYFIGKEKQMEEFLTYLNESRETQYIYKGVFKDFPNMKRIAKIAYSPIKSRILKANLDSIGMIDLKYDTEALTEYQELSKILSDIYVSVDIEEMTEKEIITFFSRKIYEEFSSKNDKGYDTNFFNESYLEETDNTYYRYTYIMKMLLDMAYFKNSLVLGYLPEDDTIHVWNQIILSDGEVYYVDIGWAYFQKTGIYNKRYILNKNIDFNDGKREEILRSIIQNYGKFEELLIGENIN